VLPINPLLKGFLMHVLQHPSGFLGDRGLGFYRKIVDVLSASKVQIISIATDNDRGNCSYQSNLIRKYQE
jgi:hypothetical protein